MICHSILYYSFYIISWFSIILYSVNGIPYIVYNFNVMCVV